jgi:hypothetical protein
VFLVLRQIMPIAAGLAGGHSLNSFGAIGRGIGWAAGSASRASKPFLGKAADRAANGAAQRPFEKVRLPDAPLALTWRNTRR